MHPNPTDAALGAARVPRLELVGVSKRYGAVDALRGACLTVAPGEIHALCGHNGAGKSTLVKILAGLVHPDAGSLRLDGRLVVLRTPRHAQSEGISIVDQEISLVDELTVADNVLLGLAEAPFVQRRRRSNTFVHQLLDRVGLTSLDAGRQTRTLTLGERQLVEVARAIGREPSVLILDEPTATLSDAEARRVFTAIRTAASHGTAVIFVSHRLGEVLALCDRATVMRDGRIVATGPVESFTRDRIIELMVDGVLEPRSSPRARDRRGGAIRLRRVAVARRLQPTDLDVAHGEIVALAGQVGSGATELLRAVAGLVPRAGGEVVIGERVVPLVSPRRATAAGIHYISSDRKAEGLFLQRTTRLNLVATRLDQLTRFGVLRPRAVATEGDRLAALVGLQRRGISAVAELSGGNQQRAFVGRCLEHPNSALVLLDEPTRGVDVAGRAEIHALIRLLAASGKAVIFSSTELDEILDLAHRVVTLFRGRVVAEHSRAHVTASQLLGEMTHTAKAAA